MELTHQDLSEEEAIQIGARIGLFFRRWTEDPQRRYDLHEKIIKPELHLEPGKRVLEVGVGVGDHLISYQNIDYVGIDSNELGINEARIHARMLGIPAERIVCVSALEIPFPAQIADRVFSSCTLHELEDPYKALGEFDRLLRKGGRMVLVERMSAYHETTAAQARLREEPTGIPQWLSNKGYRTECRTFKATYWGEHLEEEPSFDFWICSGEKS